MAITDPREGENYSNNLICPRCSTSLPLRAIFCSSCGERIKKEKNEQGEAHIENGDAHAQEQKVDGLLRVPSHSRTHLKGLQSYHSHKNNEVTGQTCKSSSLPLDVEAPAVEELGGPSLPVAAIHTKKHDAVPLSEPKGGQITRLYSRVHAAYRQMVDVPGLNSASTNRDGTLIRSSWLLARALANRVRNDSLVRNSIYIMATTVVTGAIGYLYWIVATHIYSVHDIGLASALLSVMGLTTTLASLGIGSTLIQLLPRREAGFTWSLTLNAGLATGTLSGLLAGAIAVLVLPLFSHQFAIVWHDAAYALVFIVGVPLSIITGLLDQVFVAERAAGKFLVRSVAHSMLKLPLLVLLVGAGVLGIFSSPILALVVTLIGASLLLVPRLGRHYCLAMRGIGEQVREMLSSLVGNHFINLGSVLPAYLMPVFVTVRLSAVDNAYYSIPGMLSSFFFIVSPAVAAALFAEGSHSAHDVLRKARSSAGIIGLILGPAMLTVFLGGHYILLIFGPAYAQHGLLVLMIFTASAVPDAITNIYVSVLRVQGRLRAAVMLNLSMASLNLALAWILLPVLGAAGAPCSFLLAQVAGSLIAGVDFIRIRRQGRRSAGQSEPGTAEMQNSYQTIEELP